MIIVLVVTLALSFLAKMFKPYDIIAVPKSNWR